jgi:hypothetical protein
MEPRLRNDCLSGQETAAGRGNPSSNLSSVFPPTMPPVVVLGMAPKTFNQTQVVMSANGNEKHPRNNAQSVQATSQ